MIITVNGTAREVPEGIRVDALVASLGHPDRGVAVAIGDAVVPRTRWEATTVVDGAVVEILTAVQGG